MTPNAYDTRGPTRFMRRPLHRSKGDDCDGWPYLMKADYPWGWIACAGWVDFYKHAVRDGMSIAPMEVAP